MLVDTLNCPLTSTAGHEDPDLFDACALAARGALSGNTERAMRSDLAVYAAWCIERGVRALPARAETVAAFVDAMAKVRAPATVRRYVASIAAAHRAIGLGKTVQSEPVRRALQRMHRRKGRRQEQARGSPGRCASACSRSRAMDSSTRATARCSRSPTTRCCAGASWWRCKSRTSLRNLTARRRRWCARSKADPEGRGATAYVARDSMALVREWLERSGVREGRLFRSLCRGEVGKRLDASQVPRIFKAMAERAGVPEEVVEHISRAQHAGGRGAGHGRRRHPHAGHPASGTMEDDGDGQPLWRAPPCAAQRRCAARPTSASRVGRGAYHAAHPRRHPPACTRPKSVQTAVFHRRVIASQFGRAPCGRVFGARGASAAGRAPRTRETGVEPAGCNTVWCYPGLPGHNRGDCPVAGWIR